MKTLVKVGFCLVIIAASSNAWSQASRLYNFDAPYAPPIPAPAYSPNYGNTAVAQVQPTYGMAPQVREAQNFLSSGEKGPYWSAGMGVVSPADRTYSDSSITGILEYNIGFNFSGAVGYAFGNNFRVDGEVGYIRSGYKRASLNGTSVTSDIAINAYSFFLNGYLDIPTQSIVTPYVGGGFGPAIIKENNGTVVAGGRTLRFDGSSATEFAMHADIGVGFAVSKSISIVPSYRFIYISDGKGGYSDDKVSLFNLGLRGKF